jgi:thioredoxin reductase
MNAEDNNHIMQDGRRLAYDVVVLGGGFSGVSCALLLARCQLKVLVLDSNRPRNRASHAMHGFLSRDGANPMEVLDEARKQLLAYSTVTWLSTEALGYHESSDSVQVRFKHSSRTRYDSCSSGSSGEGVNGEGGDGRCSEDGEARVTSRYAVVATGVQDQLPELEGFQDIYGVTGHHCPFCDGYEHRGKKMAVYGRGEKASGLALELLLWSDDIVVCLDGGSESEVPEKQLRHLQKHNIPIISEPIASLKSKKQLLEKICFASGRELERDVLWFNTGREQHCDLTNEHNLPLTPKQKLATREFGELPAQDGDESRSSRVFAVGNCAHDTLDMVAAACASGAKAAFEVSRRVLRESYHIEEL